MTSPPEFVVWDALAGQTFASLEGLENVAKVFELQRGVSRAKGFPDDATFRMNRRYPKRVQVADCMVNFEKVTVASKRVCDLLASKGAENVEYLPVTILNHKGRVASSDHVIVNPLKVVDCIDRSRSNLSWNEIDSDYIDFLEALVLDPRVLDPGDVLFRAKHLAAVVFLRKDVAEELDAQGLTGAQFIPVDEFTI